MISTEQSHHKVNLTAVQQLSIILHDVQQMGLFMELNFQLSYISLPELKVGTKSGLLTLTTPGLVMRSKAEDLLNVPCVGFINNKMTQLIRWKSDFFFFF